MAVIPRRAVELDVGSDRIAFDVCGDGARVLVLLHGSGGNRATWWPVVPALAREHTVVVLDLRGHGRSTDADHRLGVEAVAGDLELIRTELGVERWTVAGHSLGGYLAAGYAARHRDRCSGLAVVSSTGGVTTPQSTAFAQRLAERMATWTPVQAADETASLSPDHNSARPQEAYLCHALRSLNPPPDPATPAARMQELVLDPAALDGVPTVFVTGERDQLAPPEVVRSCAAAVATASYLELPSAGHLCFWEQPEAFIAALTAMLA